MTNILQLAQDAADELSLVRPAAIAGVTDNNTAQKLFRHLTKTCRQLAGRYDWQVLRREKIFTAVAQAEQTGQMPADFKRFATGTFFNRTKRQRVIGPMTPEEWQSYQAVTYGSVIEQFIVRQNQILITPTPTAGHSMAYEYITDYIGTDQAGTNGRIAFSNDNDIAYFDDELVVLGIVWRYRKAEGQDYSEEFRDFELRFYDEVKLDGSRRTLDMSGADTSKARVPVAPRVPDTLIF